MSDQHFLSRLEASDYCKRKGLSVEKSTLQKFATVGGGPTYRLFGNRAVYTSEDLDSWIEQKLSAPRACSSEAAQS